MQWSTEARGRTRWPGRQQQSQAVNTLGGASEDRDGWRWLGCPAKTPVCLELCMDHTFPLIKSIPKDSLRWQFLRRFSCHVSSPGKTCLACLHRSHHPCPSLLTQGFCKRGGRQQAVSTGCPACRPQREQESRASEESYGSVSTGAQTPVQEHPPGSVQGK